MRTIAVSGGFDPLHVGHLNLINLARALGDRVVVIVDSDEYVSSKHKLLMPQAERLQIVQSLSGVHTCIPNKAANGDCSGILYLLRPSIFLVGPDKTLDDVPEFGVCKDFGIDVVQADSLKKEHSSRNYAKPQYDNPPVCCSVMLYAASGSVLVCKRRDNGKWDLPGGFLEPGETLARCVIREVKEETQIAAFAHPVYFGDSTSTYEDGREVLLVMFTSRCDSALPTHSTEEMTEFQWVRDVPENMNNETDAAILARFLKENR